MPWDYGTGSFLSLIPSWGEKRERKSLTPKQIKHKKARRKMAKQSRKINRKK